MLSALKSHTVGLLTGKRISENDMAWLWTHMTSAYGFKFMKLYGTKDNGVWLEALSDLAPEDLSYGFKKLLKTITQNECESKEAWPPNVKEFRMYCDRNLSDYGLPDVNRAFIELERNEWRAQPVWSHVLVREAASKLKPDPLAHRGILFEQFAGIYEALVQDYLRKQE